MLWKIYNLFIMKWLISSISSNTFQKISCNVCNISFFLLPQQYKSSHWVFSTKKCVVKSFAKFTGKHLCQFLFFNKLVGLNKVPTPVFFYEFCEIFRNNFFTEQLWTTDSSSNMYSDHLQCKAFSIKPVLSLEHDILVFSCPWVVLVRLIHLLNHVN